MRRLYRITGRLMFLFALALMGWGVSDHSRALADEPPKADAPRANYFPKATLQTQDGKEVDFYKLIKGKIVLINFMYTRCDGKLCGDGMKNLVKVQNALGDRLGREVFMYSITLDPEHDTPEVLKDYAKSYGVKPGWTFLTAKPEDINLKAKAITDLRGSLGLFNSDPKKDADLKQHTGMMRIGNESLDKWSTTSVLSTPDQILQVIERMKSPKALQK